MKVRHFGYRGRVDRARVHAESLVARLAPTLQHTADAPWLAANYSRRAALAESYACLQRASDAARETDRHVAEARRARNAIVLPRALVNAAYVDALIGRRDIAVDRLEEALKLPAGQTISRALLRADPSWAPLRGYPPFEDLIRPKG
jgi:hypothetical protein